MMETNEIMKALRVCATTKPCSECPYEVDEGKCWTKDFAAAELIEKQERQIQTLKWERDVAVEQAAMEIQELRNSLAVLGQANAALRDKVPEWIPVTERLPEPGKMVLLTVSGKVKNISLVDAYELGEFNTDEGWILEMWPEWEDPKVTYWMPLPELPEEEKDEK